MSGWFYTKAGFVNDKIIGPVDKNEIARLISIRKLRKNAIVSHPVETNNEWVRLSDSPLFEIYQRFHKELTQKAAKKKQEKTQQRRKKQQEIVVAKQEKKEAKQKQRAGELSSQNKRRATTPSNDKRTNSPGYTSSKPMAPQAKKDYPYLSQYLRIAVILVDVTHGISFVALFASLIYYTYNLIQAAYSGSINAEGALLSSVVIIIGGVLSFYAILWSRIISLAFLEFVGVIINIESNTRK
jgi:CRISPR-associated DxTHG motif protein